MGVAVLPADRRPRDARAELYPVVRARRGLRRFAGRRATRGSSRLHRHRRRRPRRLAAGDALRVRRRARSRTRPPTCSRPTCSRGPPTWRRSSATRRRRQSTQARARPARRPRSTRSSPAADGVYVDGLDADGTPSTARRAAAERVRAGVRHRAGRRASRQWASTSRSSASVPARWTGCTSLDGLAAVGRDCRRRARRSPTRRIRGGPTWSPRAAPSCGRAGS